MMLNPCPTLAGYGIDEAECEVFADGAVYQVKFI